MIILLVTCAHCVIIYHSRDTKLNYKIKLLCTGHTSIYISCYGDELLMATRMRDSMWRISGTVGNNIHHHTQR